MHSDKPYLTARQARQSIRVDRERDPEAFQREVQTYRDAMLRYLDHVSLRQAAREVGMSPTGLSKFCDGGEPYSRTVLKLREWYAENRQAAAPAERPAT